MATLTKKTVAQAGTAFALAAADVAGDAVLYAGGAKLLVMNGDASPHTVTMASEFPAQLGATSAANAVVVPAGEFAVIPIDQVYKDKSTGLVSWTYDAVTTVTVAVI